MNRPTAIDFKAMFDGSDALKIDQALESRKKIKILTQSYHDRRFMSADEQIYWQDASRSSRSHGVPSWVFMRDGSAIPGILYSFDGKDYIQSEQGIYDANDKAFISDAKVKESICRLEAEDKKINQARDWIAKQYAEGDAVLERILWAHLEFTGGQLTPFSYDGTLFFQVGRGSTQGGYLGNRDGKIYSLSTEDEYFEDSNKKRVPTAYHLIELDPGGKIWGYTGHHS